MKALLAAWVLTLLLRGSPPERHKGEDEGDARARYAEIAESITIAALDAPRPIFLGRRPRSHSMALMAAVAVIESGLRADVDTGAKRGSRGECTVFQLMPTQPGDCDRWLVDRRLAADVAHERMMLSRGACLRARGREEIMLAAYASGSCDRGKEESAARVTLSLKWFRDVPPPPL